MLRRLLLVLMMIGVAVTSGCVYWRLLQFKRQLNDFNEHFAFHSDSTHFLLAKKPVLTGSDFDKLMEVEPTRRLEDDQGYWRVYGFRKDPSDGSAPLEYRFRFNDDMLTEIRFPDQLTRLYPAATLAELLRSLGDAEVDKSEKSALSRSFSQRLVEALPSRKLLVEVLGQPSEPDGTWGEGGVETVYRYSIITDTTGEKSEKRRSYGRFFFRPDGSLARVDAGIGDHELGFTIPEQLPDSDAER